MPLRPPLSSLVLASLALALAAAPAWAGSPRPTHEAAGRLTWTSPQANPIALTPNGSFVFVANTTSNSVEVLQTSTNSFFRRIDVGMEPVSVAVRPDGLEVWVANHVSDSVSVIDSNPASPTYLNVIRTIQNLNANGSTNFDEPVGIAFASNSKAYVALSSTNRIAIVNATTYAVTGHLNIRAQDPRAIAVRNGRLYVTAFESGNQSELSGCGLPGSGSAPQCTLFLTDLLAFATNPNLPGSTKNIVIDPQVPDRDLFVFNTSNDSEIKVTSGVGTLLYGLAIDASDKVFITQTDARNAVNGITGPAQFRQDVNSDGHVNLADLANRMFTNEVAILNCAGGAGACSISSIVDLDGPSPGPATALATPYGIAISNNNATLVGTAAGTSRFFTMNSSGSVLARLNLDDAVTSGDEGQQIPKGVALLSNPSTGAAQTAYVLNTLENTVAVVNVTNPSAPTITKRVAVGLDPTPAAVRRGNIAFNNAFASTSGNFSCGSCHPDGNTDQLLWRIGGECFLLNCVPSEDEPRTTMPVRGLRDTLPLHWDGTLGDPFGGPSGATGSTGNPGTNCSLGGGGDQRACFRQLVDASLSGVMCDQSGACPPGGTILSAQAKDDMAAFLERVSYPPARTRPADDLVSASAVLGFEDFFHDQGGGAANPDTCADSNAGCHELPLGTATNSETLQAFDAPTMRGMTDRFLQFSLGPTGTEEFLAFANDGLQFAGISPLEPSIKWNPAQGMREITTFGAAFAVFQPVYGVRPLDIFQMFEEASTGHSGALGRQLTIDPSNAALAATSDALAGLEEADARGVINLRGVGLTLSGSKAVVSYQSGTDKYQIDTIGDLSRADFLARFQSPLQSLHTVTLTAQLRSGTSEETPQPLIAPLGAQCNTGTGPSGDPSIPAGTSTFQVEGAYVSTGDAVFLNGDDTGLTATVTDTSTACSATAGHITKQIVSIPGLSRSGGTDLLQVRGANGLLSNEIPLP